MRQVNPQVHLKRHEVMKGLQEEIKPFTPTMRELQELWGLNTTSSVRRTLEYLVANEKCVVRERGEYTVYYAV